MIYILTMIISTLFVVIATHFELGTNAVFVQSTGSVHVNLLRLIRNIFFFLSFVLLASVSAFRFQVGTDYTTYSTSVISDVLSGSSTLEPLFQILVKIGNLFGTSQWVFILSSLLVIALIYRSILDQSVIPYVSVFLIVGTTFYNFSMNAVRQAIATAFFLYAVKYIKNNQLLKYIIFILIACMFHKIAVLYFPLYFVGHLRFRKPKIFLVTLFISVNLCIFQNQIRAILFVVLKNLPGLSQYARYFGSEFDNTLLTVSLSFLVVNLVVTMLIYFLSSETKFSKSLQVEIGIQLLLTLFSGMAFSIPLAFRLFYLFVPIQILLVPNLICLISNKRNRLIVQSCLIFLYVALFVLFILYDNFNGTLPYQYTFHLFN